MEIFNVSRLSPGTMTPDELEATFVQRANQLQNILECIATSALTSEKQNLLLVGPRGVGKTHLISMIYYRLKEVEELNDHMLTAWLHVEEWSDASFQDFLLKILFALFSQAYGDQAAEQRVAPIRALELKEAESTAVGLIKELVGDRTLMILLENFGGLIQKLGNFGGMQLYSFIRETGFCCLIATSPGPVSRVLPPGSPFQRNFFRTEQLEELSFNDAVQLVSKMAQYQKNGELSSLIATPRGRARVQALSYLAGGNHRAYVVFAPLLIQESIGKLSEMLLQTLDHLMPFYNSRIACLSQEQSRIIEFVCESRHPVQMADVAQGCTTTPTSALAQLESLCKMGYLQSYKIKDARYYELSELLMRLSFEVKKHRNKPIGLLLDLLRLWYSPFQLKKKQAALPLGSVPEHEHIQALPSLDQNGGDPATAEYSSEYNAAALMNDDVRALQAVEKLVATRKSNQDLIAQASCLIRLERIDQALAVCDAIIESNQASALVWQMRAWILNKIGRFDEALSSCKKSIELDPGVYRTWCEQASILLNLNRLKEALDSCDTAIGLNNKDGYVWEIQGMALKDMEKLEEAVSAFSKAVELDPKQLSSRMKLCATLVELNRCEEALRRAQQAAETYPEEQQVSVLLGSILASLRRYEESLQSFNKAVSLGNNSPFVRYKIVELLLALDRWREGMASLDKALDQFSHLENADAGDTRALIRCLLPNLFAPRILQLSIKVLFLIYQKHRTLGILGQGLIECIPEVTASTSLSDADVGLWRNSWQMIAGRMAEFRLPLRLLDSATRFRKTRDLRIFMDLPLEERTLLEQMTGVHIDAIA